MQQRIDPGIAQPADVLVAGLGQQPRCLMPRWTPILRRCQSDESGRQPMI
jgi:hypothetical protein